MIIFNKVEIEIGDIHLKDINFSLSPGDFLSLEGESGSGKSTIVKMIIGALKNYTGDIINTYSPSEILYIAQQEATLDPLSIFDNITLGNIRKNNKNKEKITNIIHSLGVRKSVLEKMGNLSGGQKVRVLLARAIFSESKCIILDEAFTGLDKKTKNEISKIIFEKFKGCILIIISHDKNIIKNINQNFDVSKHSFKRVKKNNDNSFFQKFNFKKYPK